MARREEQTPSIERARWLVSDHHEGCHGHDDDDHDKDHDDASPPMITTVLKYPPEIKKVPDDLITFSKITV